MLELCVPDAVPLDSSDNANGGTVFLAACGNRGGDVRGREKWSRFAVAAAVCVAEDAVNVDDAEEAATTLRRLEEDIMQCNQ